MNKTTMKEWLSTLGQHKKALPILSFPAVSLLGCTVRELISDSSLQAEGMALVTRRCDSAAAVSLMDLSVEAECFGAEVRFSDSEVPTVVGRLIEDMEAAQALAMPEVGSARSGLYLDAIRKAKKLITDRPVLAGIIGPFSLAARLLDVTEIMMDCYDNPDMVQTVLEKATAFLIKYALAYKEAGADGIVMAEPVAGLLSPTLEQQFAAPFVRQLVEAVQNDDFIVVYHNCGDNTPLMLDSIFSCRAAGYHFGNSVDLRTIIDKADEGTVIMGNVDPAGVLRMGTPKQVREATLDVLEKCGAYPYFVLSSGCDVPPMTPWENIDVFFRTAEEYYGTH